jgi:DNA-binding transcriptional MerR regulator
MQISEVSQRLDLSKDTLRYYERIGLIPDIRRNSSGNRDYTENDCGWIAFIKCMRDAGLHIDTLKEYLDLYQQGDTTIKARKELLTEERKKLASKIDELQQTLERLDYKIESYEKVILDAEEELMSREEFKAAVG